MTIDTVLIEFAHAAAIVKEVLVRLSFCVELRDEGKIAHLGESVLTYTLVFSPPSAEIYLLRKFMRCRVKYISVLDDKLSFELCRKLTVSLVICNARTGS